MAVRTQRRPAHPEDDIPALRDQVAEIGSQLTALLDNARTGGTALAEAELSALQSRLQDIGTDLRDRGREALGRVEDTVKEHPAGSLLAAFAAGALLVALLRR